jgi:hypothetical protein
MAAAYSLQTLTHHDRILAIDPMLLFIQSKIYYYVNNNMNYQTVIDGFWLFSG